VPDVLLSGDHARIAAWREAQSLERTRAAEERDRAAWTARDAMIQAREAEIAAREALARAKAAKKARRRRSPPSGD
jgi:tRNA (guanine37-N1)-methyltransferase